MELEKNQIKRGKGEADTTEDPLVPKKPRTSPTTSIKDLASDSLVMFFGSVS